jgi:manganese efflux pump family protein
MSGQLLILGIIIGSNNLAAALALGALGQAHLRTRIISVFGFFEFLIPLVGLALGNSASKIVGEAASYITPAILLILAGLSFYAATKDKADEKKLAKRITTWKGLVLLELSLSLDNLLVGFGLGVRSNQPVSPLLLAFTIAFFSIVYTWLGLKAGSKTRNKWPSYAEAGAGFLLVLLALLIWFEVL